MGKKQIDKYRARKRQEADTEPDDAAMPDCGVDDAAQQERAERRTGSAPMSLERANSAAEPDLHGDGISGEPAVVVVPPFEDSQRLQDQHVAAAARMNGLTGTQHVEEAGAHHNRAQRGTEHRIFDAAAEPRPSSSNGLPSSDCLGKIAAAGAGPAIAASSNEDDVPTSSTAPSTAAFSNRPKESINAACTVAGQGFKHRSGLNDGLNRAEEALPYTTAAAAIDLAGSMFEEHEAPEGARRSKRPSKPTSKWSPEAPSKRPKTSCTELERSGSGRSRVSFDVADPRLEEDDMNPTRLTTQASISSQPDEGPHSNPSSVMPAQQHSRHGTSGTHASTHGKGEREVKAENAKSGEAAKGEHTTGDNKTATGRGGSANHVKAEGDDKGERKVDRTFDDRERRMDLGSLMNRMAEKCRELEEITRGMTAAVAEWGREDMTVERLQATHMGKVLNRVKVGLKPLITSTQSISCSLTCVQTSTSDLMDRWKRIVHLTGAKTAAAEAKAAQNVSEMEQKANTRPDNLDLTGQPNASGQQDQPGKRDMVNGQHDPTSSRSEGWSKFDSGQTGPVNQNTHPSAAAPTQPSNAFTPQAHPANPSRNPNSSNGPSRPLSVPPHGSLERGRGENAVAVQQERAERGEPMEGVEMVTANGGNMAEQRQQQKSAGVVSQFADPWGV